MAHADELFRNEVLIRDDFTPHVGKKFRVKNIQGEYYIDLVSAEAQDIANWPNKFRPPFILIFSTPPNVPVMPNGQFLIEAPGTTTWAMNIAPILTIDKSKGQLYQAVFA